MTKALEKALLQHFEYKKLDIAYAINKPFPFFEALRDNSVITDRLYKVRPGEPPQGSPDPTKHAPLVKSKTTTHQRF